MSLQVQTEPVPPRAALLPVLPGISRIVADNPGRMTYHGTNTYLLEGEDGVSVLDPGPDEPRHVADIVRLSPGPIRRILLTHTHADHVGAVPGLQAVTGAPAAAWHASADPAFSPGQPLEDGDTIAGLRVLFTPGHAADHVCFARADGVVFSGDLVMGWSSTVVSPPGGDMAAYFASLRRLLARPDDTIYLPGHGPAVSEPHAYVSQLLAHRVAREQAILLALTAAPATPAGLVRAIYPRLDPALHAAAERSVLAHLVKLQAEGHVRPADAADETSGSHWERVGEAVPLRRADAVL